MKKTDPRYATWLMGDEDACPVWRPEDLESMLEHQLDARLSRDIGRPVLALDEALERFGDFPGLQRMSFGDLLLHPSPPIGAIALLKEFAKLKRRASGDLFPREIATVLYFASIAAAIRLGAWITKLDDESVRCGFDWVLRQTWVRGPIRRLVEEAWGRLDLDPGPPLSPAPAPP